MIFLQKNKKKGEYFWKFISTIFIFLFLFVIQIFFPIFSRNLVVTIAKPVWNVKDFTIGVSDNIFSYFLFKQNLYKENLALKEQIETLNLKINDYNSIQNQNEELKSILGRDKEEGKVLARIISKPPQSPYDTFLIDVGTKQGFILNDLVYSSGNVIIGKISEINPNFSQVTLFSDSNQKIQVTIARTGSSFEISGKGGANFQIDVPKETDIVWGDVFEYQNKNSSVVGSVYYIDSNSQSSFKTIYAKSPGNIFSSKWVFVEKQNI